MIATHQGIKEDKEWMIQLEGSVAWVVKQLSYKYRLPDKKWCRIMVSSIVIKSS